MNELDPQMTERPNAARIYDYLLGGHHNTPMDRLAAKKMMEIAENTLLSVRANRAFLGRAVRFLVSQGITQILDIGSGLPTAGNVHQIAHTLNPQTRIVYVDHDPTVVEYSNHILSQDNVSNAIAIKADLNQIEDIFNHPQTKQLIDFSQPVAVMLLAVLHFITDDETAKAVAPFVYERVTPKSYLAISHGAIGQDEAKKRKSDNITSLYQNVTTPLRLRTHEETLALFGSFTLLSPGLVASQAWRPDPDNPDISDELETSGVYAGIGIKS